MKINISNRDRFKAIARGQRPGDIMIIDWFHRCLSETPLTWVEQGAPREMIHGSTFSGAKTDALSEYFGYDRLHALREIVSGMHRLDLFEKTEAESFYPTPPIVPAFEIRRIGRLGINTSGDWIPIPLSDGPVIGICLRSNIIVRIYLSAC